MLLQNLHRRGCRNCFHNVANAEFGNDVLTVSVYRMDAYSEDIGNLLTRLPFAYEV